MAERAVDGARAAIVTDPRRFADRVAAAAGETPLGVARRCAEDKGGGPAGGPRDVAGAGAPRAARPGSAWWACGERACGERRARPQTGAGRIGVVGGADGAVRGAAQRAPAYFYAAAGGGG